MSLSRWRLNAITDIDIKNQISTDCCYTIELYKIVVPYWYDLGHVSVENLVSAIYGVEQERGENFSDFPPDSPGGGWAKPRAFRMPLAFHSRWPTYAVVPMGWRKFACRHKQNSASLMAMATGSRLWVAVKDSCAQANLVKFPTPHPTPRF